MEQRSINILNNLKNCVENGRLSTEQFPVKDVVELVSSEYKTWIESYIQKLNLYISIYNSSINMAVTKGDKIQLIGLLEELIADLLEMSERDAFKEERLRELEEGVNQFIVRCAQSYARAAYEKYLFHLQPLKLAFQGKGVIYTVITGGYDALVEPEYIDKDFDYICFTDDENLTSDLWSVQYIENIEGLDSARLSRKYKILCHEFLKEYDFSIYVDGKVQIIGDLKRYLEMYSRGSSMLCFPHFLRECAYEEAKVCAAIGKDVPDVIEKQMKGYLQEGYPVDNGLIDGACLVRLHHDHVLQEVMTCWWNEVKNKSRRDQLSFGYACWKNDFHYDLSDLYTYKNDFLRKSREWEKPY
ncbi:MAG: DUF616 domain-containing protein [Lachnospiraceae bacterium]|nr:DUF616 domain-containing protein [Lachnospiraceae bacterium]